MFQATLPEPPSPPPIIVTARALADPAAERAYSVDTIDAARLKNAPSTQLDQLLKDVPGLQLFRRSDARSGHPTSQGVTLRALGGNDPLDIEEQGALRSALKPMRASECILLADTRD